jgi:hypothetical protein
MNKLKLTLIGLALVFVSTFTNAISVSGNAAIQTDYIWRGMTQNDGQNSVNVGLDVDFENGFLRRNLGGSSRCWCIYS